MSYVWGTFWSHNHKDEALSSYQHAVSHSELPLGLTKLHVFVNLFLFKNLKFKIFKNTFLSSEFFLFQKEYGQKFQKYFSFICPFQKKKNQKSRIQKLFILFFKVLFFQKKKYPKSFKKKNSPSGALGLSFISIFFFKNLLSL